MSAEHMLHMWEVQVNAEHFDAVVGAGWTYLVGLPTHTTAASVITASFGLRKTS